MCCAFFLLYETVNSKEMMHLHIIMCEMIVFDIDIISSAFLDTLILIYTYIHMYYILPKIYVNMHRFFNTSKHLWSICICAKRVKQQFAQSTITFGYIVCVHSIVECIFLLNCMQHLLLRAIYKKYKSIFGKKRLKDITVKLILL